MTKKKVKLNKLIKTISIVCVIIECIFNSVSYASTSLSSVYDSVKKSKKQNEWKLVYADSEGNGAGANWFDSPGWYVVMYDSGVGLQDNMLVLKYEQTSKSQTNGSNAYDLYAVGNNGYDTPANSSAYSGDIKNANIPRTAVLSDTSKTYTVSNYDEIDGNGAKSIDQEVGNKETPKTKTTTKVVNESEVKPEWTLQSEKYTYNNDGEYYKKYVDDDGNVYLVDTGEKVQNNESIYEAEDLRTNDNNGGFLGELLDGVVGIFLLIPKMLLIVIGAILGFFMGLFTGKGFLTIEDILFNKVTITDIDFFNLSTTDNTVNTIRANVAAWYVGVRNVAAAALVLILIYVGIRMAISTVAEEKAHYKEMLINWFTGLCILFALHFIILLTITANNVIVSTLYKASGKENGKHVAMAFFQQSLSIKATVGLSNALCYVGLESLTFAYLMSYIKRMITIAFLIIIAPLVTVTYSIDKMGDGKSQALNTWFEEFMFNVLIQPFHCIAYLALCTTALDAANDGNLKSGIIAICLLYFLAKSAEEIVKNIFGIKASSMPSPASSIVAGAAIAQTAAKIGTKIAGGKDDGGKGNKAPNIPTSQNATDTRSAQNNMNGANGVAGGARGAGGAGRAGGGTQTPNNRNPFGQASKKKLSGIASSNAFKVWATANAMTTGILGGIGLTTATGTAQGAVSGATIGGNLAASISSANNKKITEGHYKRNAAKAFNNYKSATGMTDEEISNRAMALLRGDEDIDPDSEFVAEDQELRDAMSDLTNYYQKEGKSEKDSIKATGDVLDDIKNGKQGEETGIVRLSGNIQEQAFKHERKKYRKLADETDDEDLKRDYEQMSVEYNNKLRDLKFRKDLAGHKVDMGSEYGNTNHQPQGPNPRPNPGPNP